ncbi:hypothetical protein CBR_g31832 [Chara braunii]|uniref:Uncharacterized protein n=1 Tax=Chara braunii TaxID=69332 RepID=A0A388LFR8_CHABU|nr:hypothetical protein CBR_g31832 [Chara braunii]|eukprot:GBG81156.1 hypothetical protein CBR_g31832 [Chara braunii]
MEGLMELITLYWQRNARRGLAALFMCVLFVLLVLIVAVLKDSDPSSNGPGDNGKVGATVRTTAPWRAFIEAPDEQKAGNISSPPSIATAEQDLVSIVLRRPATWPHPDPSAGSYELHPKGNREEDLTTSEGGGARQPLPPHTSSAISGAASGTSGRGALRLRGVTSAGGRNGETSGEDETKVSAEDSPVGVY